MKWNFKKFITTLINIILDPCLWYHGWHGSCRGHDPVSPVVGVAVLMILEGCDAEVHGRELSLAAVADTDCHAHALAHASATLPANTHAGVVHAYVWVPHNTILNRLTQLCLRMGQRKYHLLQNNYRFRK